MSSDSVECGMCGVMKKMVKHTQIDEIVYNIYECEICGRVCILSYEK